MNPPIDALLTLGLEMIGSDSHLEISPARLDDDLPASCLQEC